MGESKSESTGECPLCLDPFELDDHSFYPCPCDYQICRFCWHRIKSDENGLCPACRQPYSELPAQYKPLSKEQLTVMKVEKKNKACERKAKLAESRKHLVAVRVVQKCLVFVVGLSSRIADSETLKRPEYFGKFGKIHKCVVNNNTNYAGSTGHSASAYITFYKSDDALRAVQQTNNTQIDGRTLKASLGTTKYCSQFLKALTCNKPDCMYLHELGDEKASFTKEDMQQGKHQEYEQELHDEFFRRESEVNQEAQFDRYKTVYTLRSEANGQPIPLKVEAEQCTNNIPQTNGGSNRTTPSPSNAWGDNVSSSLSPTDATSKSKREEINCSSQGFSIFSNIGIQSRDVEFDPFSCGSAPNTSWDSAVFSGETYGDPARRLLRESSESNGYCQSRPYNNGIPQLLNILESRAPDDDLEFDPIKECQKGLEELMQKERMFNCVNLSESFPPTQISGTSGQDQLSQSFSGFHSNLEAVEQANSSVLMQQSIDRREWQAGLRALLPNVNIQFQSVNQLSAASTETPHAPSWDARTWNNTAQYNMSSEDPAIISTRKSANPMGYWENNNYHRKKTDATISQDSQDAFLSSTKPSCGNSQLFTNWKPNGCISPDTTPPPGFKSDVN